MIPETSVEIGHLNVLNEKSQFYLGQFQILIGIFLSGRIPILFVSSQRAKLFFLIQLADCAGRALLQFAVVDGH
jgi:hypothetical protein